MGDQRPLSFPPCVPFPNSLIPKRSFHALIFLESCSFLGIMNEPCFWPVGSEGFGAKIKLRFRDFDSAVLSETTLKVGDKQGLN